MKWPESIMLIEDDSRLGELDADGDPRGVIHVDVVPADLAWKLADALRVLDPQHEALMDYDEEVTQDG